LQKEQGHSGPAPSNFNPLFLQDKVTTPVLLPALLIGLGAERLLFAVADGLDAVRAHASLGESIFHGARALIAQQRELELAVALATKPQLLLLDEPMAGLGSTESARMVKLLQELRRLSQLLRRIWPQRIAVVVEKDVLHVARK